MKNIIWKQPDGGISVTNPPTDEGYPVGRVFDDPENLGQQLQEITFEDSIAHAASMQARGVIPMGWIVLATDTNPMPFMSPSVLPSS